MISDETKHRIEQAVFTASCNGATGVEIIRVVHAKLIDMAQKDAVVNERLELARVAKGADMTLEQFSLQYLTDEHTPTV